MSSEQNRNIVTGAAAHFQETEKRLAWEERRTRVTKAADILGPLSGPSAVLLDDSLNAPQMGFNGLFIVPPGTPESPDDTKWWAGESIAQDGIGGVQILYTFRPADAPHLIMMRGWETVLGSGGLRAYSNWQIVGEPIDYGTASVAAVSPFGSTVVLARKDDTVTVESGNFSRASGFSTTFTLAGTVPTGFKPSGELLLPAAPFFTAPSVAYQTRWYANGDVEIRMSAANANSISVAGLSYTTTDPPP